MLLKAIQTQMQARYSPKQSEQGGKHEKTSLLDFWTPQHHQLHNRLGSYTRQVRTMRHGPTHWIPAPSIKGDEDMSTTKELTKALSDAIPKGLHPEPHAEWIQVRLDFVQEAIDHLDWLEMGVGEWREEALSQQQKVHAAQAMVRIATRHLQAVLNKPRTHAEQIMADVAARDWLISIGSEPQ
jgi:hypothetical protein